MIIFRDEGTRPQKNQQKKFTLRLHQKKLYICKPFEVK